MNFEFASSTPASVYSAEVNMRALSSLMVMALIAGCGGVGDHSYMPPYMTLQGTIRQITLDHVPKNVHVALIWEGDGGTMGGHVDNAAEDLAVESTFPTTFTLDIKALPPDYAMIHCATVPEGDGTTFNFCSNAGLDGDAVFGNGEVIAYEDLNGNGRLDIVSDNSPTPSPDRVIGRADGTTVYYLAGRYHPAYQNGAGYFPVVNGFSVTTSTLAEPTIEGCAADPQCVGEAAGRRNIQLLKQPVSIDMTLESDSVELPQYTCGTAWGGIFGPWNADGPSHFSGPWGGGLARGLLCGDPNTCDCAKWAGLGEAWSVPDIADCPHDLPPAGTTTTCSADGKAYLYKKCFADPNNCYTPFCHWGHSSLKPGETPPANWPCPIS